MRITEANPDDATLHQGLKKRDPNSVTAAFTKYRRAVTIPDAVIYASPEITVKAFQDAVYEYADGNFRRVLYRFASGVLKNDQDAEDAVSLTINDVVYYIYSFRGGKISSYFGSSLKKRANHIAKKNRHHKETLLSQMESSTASAIENRGNSDEYNIFIKTQINSILEKETDAEIFYQICINNCDYESVAKKFEKNQPAVRKIIERAKDKIRTHSISSILQNETDTMIVLKMTSPRKKGEEASEEDLFAVIGGEINMDSATVKKRYLFSLEKIRKAVGSRDWWREATKGGE